MTELSEVREPKFLPRKIRLVMGVDPGQTRDPTAMCVIEYCEGVMDHGSDVERHCNLTRGLGLQKKAERWRCIFLDRIALGTPYGDVVERVANLLSKPQLQADATKNQGACELVVDAGGVGRGTADMLEAAGLKPIRATLHGGRETNVKGPNKFNASKEEAIALLDARLNHNRFPLTFSKHLAHGEAFKQEVADFRRTVSGAGRMQYEAASGKHDDMISAVALAVWWLSRPQNPPMHQQGGYGYKQR